MKKKLLITLSLVFALLCGMFTFVKIEGPVAYAEEGVEDVVITDNTILTEAYFADQDLFMALRKVAQLIKIENNNPDDNNILKAGDLKTVTSLDLTYKKMAVTFTNSVGTVIEHKFYTDDGSDNWVNPQYLISDTMGLESVLFGDALRTLILDNNALETVTEDLFVNMPNLTTLSIKNNVLTTVEIPASIPIHNLNLEENQLTAIDLSCLREDHSVAAECHLENNNFSDVSNIILPDVSEDKVNLYLAQNYLTDAVKSDFGGQNVSLLIQGLRKSGGLEVTANTYIRVTPVTAAEGFAGGAQDIKAKAFYRETSSLYVAGQDPVATSDANGKLVLPAGKLVIRFYNGDEEYTTGNFVAKNVDVYPNAPQIGVLVDGEQLTEIPARIDKTFQVVAFKDSSLTNSTVEVRFANGNWTAGNMIELQEAGTYTIYARVTFDGLTSTESYITISNTNSARVVWALIIIIGAVVLVVGGLYLYRWFKSGGIVAPLTDKEIAREQYKQSKRERNNKK